MFFLLKSTAGLPVKIIDFAIDSKSCHDMVLNVCNEEKILSIIDGNFDLIDTQDGVHLLKVSKSEYVKILVATLDGFLYNSKDYCKTASYYISEFTPVKNNKDVFEKLVYELNLKTKKII